MEDIANGITVVSGFQSSIGDSKEGNRALEDQSDGGQLKKGSKEGSLEIQKDIFD